MRGAAETLARRTDDLVQVERVDVAIVGGGPAGLAASVYLARFLRSVIVLEAGDSRAALIPMSHNCPGFPDGIAGQEILRALRVQASSYGADIRLAPVDAIESHGDVFLVSTNAGAIEASHVILATGIVDKAPPIEGLLEGISLGRIRLCPVCDGYEAVGKRIGVVGPGPAAMRESIFLRNFSPDVVILANSPDDIDMADRSNAAAHGIRIWDEVDDVRLTDADLEVAMVDGSTRHLDVLYSAMGCDVRSELAASIGASCDDEGFVLVSQHLETSVPGFYAIGDVAKSLNQMAVGFGHAALAATHIHNSLRNRGSFQDRTKTA
jgi:thioredoxin reductase (NADPH)